MIRSMAAAAAVGTLSVLAWSASASEDQMLLAKSASAKLQVFARSVDGKWCRSILDLRMVLDDEGSTDDAGSLIGVMDKLQKPVTTDCPEAAQAKLAVMKRGKELARFNAASADGWKFRPESDSPPVASSLPPAAHPAADLDAPPAAQKPAPSSEPPTGAAPVERTASPAVVNLDYEALLFRYLQENPKLLDGEAAGKYWGRIHHPNDYQAHSRDEFSLRRYVIEAGGEMRKAVENSDPTQMIATIQLRHQPYSFDEKRFPISENLSNLRYGKNWYEENVFPNYFGVSVENADIINGIAISPDDAEKYTRLRTGCCGPDRNIWLSLSLSLSPQTISVPTGVFGGLPTVEATIVEARIYADQSRTKLIATVKGTDWPAWDRLRAERAAIAEANAAKLRQEAEERRAAAEAERLRKEAELAEQQRQQQVEAQRQALVAQRGRLKALLDTAPLSVRINQLVLDVISVNQDLDVFAVARGRATILRKPVPVRLLLQAAASEGQAAAQWPSGLTIKTSGQLEPLAAGHWYVAAGSLVVADDDTALLTADRIVLCRTNYCVDDATSDAIISAKLDSVTQKRDVK